MFDDGELRVVPSFLFAFYVIPLKVIGVKRQLFFHVVNDLKLACVELSIGSDIYKPDKIQQDKLKNRMKPYEINDNLPVGNAKYIFIAI